MEDDNQNKPDPYSEARGRLAEEIESLRKESLEAARKMDDVLKARMAREAFFEEELRAAKEDILAKRDAARREMFINRLRPIMWFLGMFMAGVGAVLLTQPQIFQMLSENRFATWFSVSGLLMLISAVLLGFLNSAREKTFVDIDDKSYSAKVGSVEAERDQLLKKIREIESEKYRDVFISKIVSKDSEFIASDMPKLESSASVSGLVSASESNTFDVYMKSLIGALDVNIEIADKKASLLLDKGTTYLWRGIMFYVLSIVVWQVVTVNFKVGDFAVWGMISCSMTFLVVEFLAAWFLRQYKSFTDSSFNLVRVKSVFNRYFLSYLAIKEFSESPQHLVDMRVQMLKVLEEDIKWLEPAPQKAGELNHMIAMFESVSGLVEKLKVGSKADSTTASA
jgi:hypothetical protein